MNKKVFHDKVEMLSDRLAEKIRTRCEELFDSGGIDASAYDDGGHELPSTVLCAALLDAADTLLASLGDKGRRAVKNLRHF